MLPARRVGQASARAPQISGVTAGKLPSVKRRTSYARTRLLAARFRAANISKTFSQKRSKDPLQSARET